MEIIVGKVLTFYGVYILSKRALLMEIIVGKVLTFYGVYILSNKISFRS
jgi:hypothetical protein